jgi:hypothetical protein
MADVGLAVVQALQEEPAGFLPCLRAGETADLLQADADGVAERKSRRSGPGRVRQVPAARPLISSGSGPGRPGSIVP